MRSFRNNNNKRSRFRSNGDRNFKRNGENQTFSVNSNFQRKSPGKNNHNAPKLIEKYNDLAREALSKGDKILSENYFQHADHFLRISNEKEIKKQGTEFDKNESQTLNKSLDETIEKLYDTLYEVKEVLDSAEDGELEQMADILIESVEEALTVNEVNIESIKEHINSLNNLE